MSDFHSITQYGSKIRHRHVMGVTCDGELEKELARSFDHLLFSPIKYSDKFIMMILLPPLSMYII